MRAYLIRRLSLLIVTLLMLSLVSFALAFLFPGDPLVNLSGSQLLTDLEYSFIVEKYHANESILVQFFNYLQLVLGGDWGISFSSELPVFDELVRIMPASIELSAYALILSLLLGVPLGFLSGIKHNKLADHSILSGSLLGYSMPIFWLALILIGIFSLKLGWLPISGRISLLFNLPHNSGFMVFDILTSDLDNKGAALTDAFMHMILPTLSISIVTSALIIRIVRRSVIDVMSSDFIRASYARGLSSTQVIWRHGVRNVLFPILPQLALQLTTLMTNAMIVEVIFSWPGVGDWMIQAIYQRDYPAIRAGMLAVSALVVIFTLSVDMIIRLSDPLKDRETHGTI